MNWIINWDWTKRPAFVLHTHRPQDNWKKKAFNYLFPSQFQLYQAIIGSDEPWVHWYNDYKKLPIGRHPIEFKLKRKAIRNCGAWGYVFSWICLLTELIEKPNDYDAVLVCDDDIRFSTKINENEWNKFEKEHPNWKIVLFGASQQDWKNVIVQQNWYLADENTDGSFAVCLRKNIWKELLDKLWKLNAPVDSGALIDLYKKYIGSCWVKYPNWIIADITTGQISKQQTWQEGIQRYRWNLNDFWLMCFQKNVIETGLLIFVSNNLKNKLQERKRPEWVQIIYTDEPQINLLGWWCKIDTAQQYQKNIESTQTINTWISWERGFYLTNDVIIEDQDRKFLRQTRIKRGNQNNDGQVYIAGKFSFQL